MEAEELEKWLEMPEDDHHDFKKEWYHSGKKEELVKDIFSFVNTVHHDDCFLIIGVDDERKVTGVEHDENRMNQQNLIDFIRNLPISGDYNPRVEIEIVRYDEHEVDVIHIFDTSNVPVFLNKRWKQNEPDAGRIYVKGAIKPQQVFVREGDVNTSRDTTASYHQVELLWKKHFRIDQPIQERYKYVLQDADNWSYYENDKTGYLYNLNPDFNMVLIDDDQTRNRVAAYSLNQFRMNISWGLLKLMFRQVIVAEIQVVWLDSAQFIVVAPDIGRVGNIGQELYYNCFTADSLRFAVQKFLEITASEKGGAGVFLKFYSSVPVFDSKLEEKNIEEYLSKQFAKLLSLISISDEELSNIRGCMKLEFNKDDLEMSKSFISGILMRQKLGVIVRKIIIKKTSVTNM